MATNPSVTDAELAVLQCLWDHGDSVKRDVVQQLYPDASASDLATVQKLLERLEAKGHVSRDRSRVPHVYSATIGRAELAAREVQAVAKRIARGSLVSLMMNLVEGKRLSKRDRDRIRAVLDESDPPKGRKGS